jgi:predicted ArsR family transcriptional regulator
VSEKTDARAGRPRRDRLPHNRQRERILRMVREHHGAADAVELTSQTGLHVTTVRFHLDALCDEAVIVRIRLNRPGAGRPRTGYVVVEERLDYRVLAEVLAMELGKTVQTRGERAERAGRRWAARMMAARGDDDDHGDTIEADTDDALDRAAGRASQVFTRMGFAPELADAAGGERVIKLHACPVRELARAHPEVGCGLHRGVLRGLVDNRAHDPAMSARLEPFVEPERCLARVVAE